MTTNNEKYNGYANYETWACALWIDNDEGSAGYVEEMAQEAIENAEATRTFTRQERAQLDFADTLKDWQEEQMPEVEGLFADLLNSAFGEIDWMDLAEKYIGGYIENNPDCLNDETEEDDSL